jgi:hypothetical protein
MVPSLCLFVKGAKKINKIFICKIFGHKSRISKCPYTLNVYDVCDRCEGTVIIGSWNPSEQ